MATVVLELFAKTEDLITEAAQQLSEAVVTTILEDLLFSCSRAYGYQLQSRYGSTSPDAAARSTSPADLPLVQALTAAAPELNSTRVLMITQRGDDGGERPSAGRRLHARAAAKGTTGAGGARAAVPTSSIKGQGWTTDDWDVGGVRVEGAVNVPRYVGRANVVLGGLLIHQVWSTTSVPDLGPRPSDTSYTRLAAVGSTSAAMACWSLRKP